MRIGIIGGGFMGEAFLRGILRAHVAAPADMAIAEMVPARRLQLAEHGVRVTDDVQSATIGADVVLLAVKPQDLAHVAGELQGAMPRDAVLISIAAGVRSSKRNACARRTSFWVMLSNGGIFAVNKNAASAALQAKITPRSTSLAKRR